jgi:hypothetical protein
MMPAAAVTTTLPQVGASVWSLDGTTAISLSVVAGRSTNEIETRAGQVKSFQPNFVSAFFLNNDSFTIQ